MRSLGLICMHYYYKIDNLRVGQELGGLFKNGDPEMKMPGLRIWRAARACRQFSIRPQPFCPSPGTSQ